jgi:hypothetical protein
MAGLLALPRPAYSSARTHAASSPPGARAAAGSGAGEEAGVHLLQQDARLASGGGDGGVGLRDAAHLGHAAGQPGRRAMRMGRRRSGCVPADVPRTRWLSGGSLLRRKSGARLCGPGPVVQWRARGSLVSRVAQAEAQHVGRGHVRVVADCVQRRLDPRHRLLDLRHLARCGAGKGVLRLRAGPRAGAAGAPQSWA